MARALVFVFSLGRHLRFPFRVVLLPEEVTLVAELVFPICA